MLCRFCECFYEDLWVLIPVKKEWRKGEGGERERSSGCQDEIKVGRIKECSRGRESRISAAGEEREDET